MPYSRGNCHQFAHFIVPLLLNAYCISAISGGCFSRTISYFFPSSRRRPKQSSTHRVLFCQLKKRLCPLLVPPPFVVVVVDGAVSVFTAAQYQHVTKTCPTTPCSLMSYTLLRALYRRYVRMVGYTMTGRCGWRCSVYSSPYIYIYSVDYGRRTQ